MSDNRIEVEFGARTRELETGARVSTDAVKDFSTSAEQAGQKAGGVWASLGGVFSGVGASVRNVMGNAVGEINAFASASGDAFQRVGAGASGLPLVFGGVLAAATAAGAALFSFAKRGIDAADDMNDMSQKLGISVERLAGYKLAAESSGTSLEGLGQGVKRLSVYLMEHGDKLRAVGITAKDADGALIQIADQFARMPDGALKTAAAMELMGRSGADMIPLLNGGGAALGELIAKGQKLYPITTEMAQAADAFNDRMAESRMRTQGLSIMLGNYLLPTMNQMLASFSDNAREIGLVNGALVSLGELGPIGQTVAVLWANVSYVFSQVGKEIGGIAAQIAAFVRGDFAGASAIGDWMKKDAAIARKELDDLEARIMGLTKKKADASAPAGAAPKGAPADLSSLLAKTPKEKKEHEQPKSYMEYYQADLEAKKYAYAMENDLREMSKAEEAAYWRDLQNGLVMTAKDNMAVTVKVQKLELEAARETAKQQKEISVLKYDEKRQDDLGYIDSLAAFSKRELDIGAITNDEYLSQQRGFIDQRLAIEQEFIDRKLEIAKLDPDKNLVLIEQLEQQKLQIRRRYDQQVAENTRLQAVESLQAWTDLTSRASSLWDQGTQAMLNGTLTWSNAFRAIGAQLVGWFATDVVGKKVKAWVLGEVMKTSATETGVATRTAAEQAGALQSVAVWAAAAIKNITNSAWEAMAGAWKAMVGIPYIGPVLAPAVAAAAFAGVVGIAGNIASAEGGFDIPRGINPITQLHEEEMVLPKSLANNVRQMTGAGGDGAGERGGFGGTIVVQAMDSRDVVRALKQGGALHTALKDLNRGFAPK